MSYKLADGSLSTDYKLGDLFVYNDIRGGDYGTYSYGSIVKFLRNDGSSCPLFGLVEGECFSDTHESCDAKTSYASWEKLTRYSGTPITKEQDPEVVIKQSDYDSLVDEINMLRELVAEITAETDYTALSQQASTYRALNEKMTKHTSYKQGDGRSTREGELLEQLDVLFEAYDNLVYVDKEQQFKPISEMTLEDWQQALVEGAVFTTDDGELTTVKRIFDPEEYSYPIETYLNNDYTLKGRYWDARIK